MTNCVAVFASLNQAALLKRALYRQGMFVDLLRTPHCLSSTGCSFALRCSESELAALEEQCHKLGILHGGIFAEDAQDGEYRPLGARQS